MNLNNEEKGCHYLAAKKLAEFLHGINLTPITLTFRG